MNTESGRRDPLFQRVPFSSKVLAKSVDPPNADAVVVAAVDLSPKGMRLHAKLKAGNRFLLEFQTEPGQTVRVKGVVRWIQKSSTDQCGIVFDEVDDIAKAKLDRTCGLAAAQWQSRYAFTIDANVEGRAVGEIPGGYRVDIQYQPSGNTASVTTEAAKAYDSWIHGNISAIEKALESAGFEVPSSAGPLEWWQAIEYFRCAPDPSDLSAKPSLTALPKGFKLVDGLAFRSARLALADGHRGWNGTQSPLDWYGLKANILSGSDWAVVRTDGVAEFSGRFTMRSADDDHGLIVATLTGPVDLATATIPRDRVFVDWKNGALGSSVKLLLAATFEAARPAQSWAPQRYIKQGEGFWKYEQLTRSQFIAVGTGTLLNQRFSPITGIHLDVYELRPS